MRVRVKVFAILLISLFLSNIVIANNNVDMEIMPLSDIKEGMLGVGKTVLRGRDVEEFDVEILSVLEDGKMGQSLILIEASGDLIEKSGGIASGMSGSPIYIDGKLIGAIGYGWQMTDHRIGMVTPIEDMMNLFEMNNIVQEEKKIDLKVPVRVGDKSYNKIYFTNEIEGFDDEKAMIARSVKTPILVSGLTGRAKDRLAQGLDDYDIRPINGGGIYKEEGGGELKAGSAVAAQLLRGDMNVSAIGTLTYRNGNDILAFGHPFLGKGNANYILSDAYIHQIISSIQVPFKLGSPGRVKGIINQDRRAGISGEIGDHPNIIPLQINVKDRDLMVEKNYNVQVIQNQDFIEPLVASAVLQAIDTTLDRTGSGTAKVDIEVMGNKVSSNIMNLKNSYYSSSDIAVGSLSDLLEGIAMLVNNPFEEVNMAGIKFDIEIEDKVNVALIEEIKVSKEDVYPGDKIDLEVTLRPYREEVKQEIISVKIPEDAKGGLANLYVYSGQEANLNYYSHDSKELGSKANNIKSLEELLEVYQSKKKNNQLIIDLIPSYSVPPDILLHEDEDEDEDEDEGKDVDEEESYDYNYEVENILDKTVDTGYILEGSLMLELNIIDG